MELHDLVKCIHEDFVGAIFMCNKKTKKECLEKKLFGLPHTQAGFVKKVKTGMLLFLFEYEEKKLYGVYEATSDGALNIMPNAYFSSGKTFPAQILVKRIWFCKPLSEDEFSVAIKENYYKPYKFNFGLTRDQVLKLIQLFSVKKINLEQHSVPGIPNRLIKEFESSSYGKDIITGCLNDDTGHISSGEKTVFSCCRMSPISYRHTFCATEMPVLGLNHGSSPLAVTATKKATDFTCSNPTSNIHAQEHFTDAQLFGFQGGNNLHDYTNLQIQNCLKSQASSNSQKYSLFPCADPGLAVNSNVLMVNLPSLGSQGFTNEQEYRNLLNQNCPNNTSSSTALQNDSIVLNKFTDSLLYLNKPDIPQIIESVEDQEDGFLGQHHNPLDSSNFIPLLHSDLVMNKEDEYYYESDDDDLNHIKRSRLYSDTEQREPSAFSRLSMSAATSQLDQKVLRCGKSKSLKHLQLCLSEKSKQHKKKKKETFRHSFLLHDDKRSGNIAGKKLSEAYSIEIELQDVVALVDSSPIPPPSFKRRSDVFKDTKRKSLVNNDDGGDGSSFVKRRRLVRPEFNKKESQSDQSSLMKFVEGSIGIKYLDVVGSLNMELSSLKSHEAIVDKGGSLPLPTLHLKLLK